jgi:hypothetical protein
MKFNPRGRLTLAVVIVMAIAVMISFTVRADDEDDTLRLAASLGGFNEVGSPVLAPNASKTTGTFRATLSPDGKTLSYKLTWTPFATTLLFAHIHFAMPGVNGRIMAFLCGGGGKPGCAGGVATGTITAADILDITSPPQNQGVTAGDFADFLRAIRAGDAYANMHTMAYPGGEIRGQIKVISDEDEGRDRK